MWNAASHWLRNTVPGNLMLAVLGSALFAYLQRELRALRAALTHTKRAFVDMREEVLDWLAEAHANGDAGVVTAYFAQHTCFLLMLVTALVLFAILFGVTMLHPTLKDWASLRTFGAAGVFYFAAQSIGMTWLLVRAADTVMFPDRRKGTANAAE